MYKKVDKIKPYNERVGIGRKKGFRLSEESKLKISESKMGHIHDEETKNKISDSVTKYWALKKAGGKTENIRKLDNTLQNMP